jgi:regulatory protein
VRPPASAADEPDTPAELKSRALRLLARREHSRAELARKLSPHAASPQDVEAVLDALAERKQLSDERYAEQRAAVLARKFGAGRIRRELLAKGVSAGDVERAVAGDDEIARARAILQKKYREPAASREERAKRARFLQGRGFSYDVIRRALSEAGDDE